MTFYLKYRSQSIIDLDLDSVRESVEKIVKSGNLPHAILLSGPKGTGKTSVARILAKIVNCEKNQEKLSEPCNKCEQCISIGNGSNIDVIELDAASNRGIDDVRTLREAVKLAPARGRKKIYIIDEAHMLTTEASNALLKTLEEPPPHVIFILATTNPEKLIDTIRSRVTNITFKKASTEEIVRSLNRVVVGEKMEVEEGVLEQIAKLADGSFRDAIKILEQLSPSGKKLVKDDVEAFLSLGGHLGVKEFTEILVRKEVKAGIEAVEEITEGGGSVKSYIDSLIEYLRLILLSFLGVSEVESKPNLTKDEVIYLIESLLKASKDTPSSFIPQLPLEFVVIDWCSRKGGGRSGIKMESGEERGDEIKEEKIKVLKSQKEDPVKVDINTQEFVLGEAVEFSESTWAKVLLGIRPKNHSVEALLRAAKPIAFDGKTLNLGVFYKFHKERLESVQYRKLLEDTVSTIIGAPSPVRVVCTLVDPPKKEIKEVVKEEIALTEPGDEDIIKAAHEIFGESK